MRPRMNHLLAALVVLTLMSCGKKDENQNGSPSTVTLSETEAVDRFNRLFTRPAGEAGQAAASIELVEVGPEQRPDKPATRLTMKPITKTRDGKFQFASSHKVNKKNEDKTAPPADTVEVKQNFQSLIQRGQDGETQLMRKSGKEVSVFHIQALGATGIKLVPISVFPYASGRKSHQTLYDADVKIEEITLDGKGRTRYTITTETYAVSNDLADKMLIMDQGIPAVDTEGKRRFYGIPVKNFDWLKEEKSLTKVGESKSEWVQSTP